MLNRRLALAVLSALGAAVTVAMLQRPALAHETRGMGDHQLVVGWLDEPAVAGFMNAVQLIASHEDGDPVEDAALQVEVIFGDQNAGEKMPPAQLEPAFGTPGEYHAFLIPTRPGTYTFHIFGTLEPGEDLDESFTSGEQTFDDVESAGDLEFPVRDPSQGELAGRLDRLGPRIDEAANEADSAGDRATLATWLAVGGLAVGAVGLIAAGLAVSKARRPG